MAKKSIQEQIADAEHQMEIWSNREKRLANREKYLRSARDRKRTHRLIQYGVAFECNHKELEVLTDLEVYELVESLMDIPEVVVLLSGRSCVRIASGTRISASDFEKSPSHFSFFQLIFRSHD